jgi:pimeloyl-ACP methyl ester carboxylesterase
MAPSTDGTSIAFDREGEGPPVVLVGGFPDRSANTRLLEHLSQRFTVFNYDRRGHGDSGDTQPWALQREVEDLDAVVDAAGGAANVFGTSGNGFFALVAASYEKGLRLKKLAVWEPPFIVDDSRPAVPRDYTQKLTELLVEGRRGDMVELFLTAAVGMPPEVVSPLRSMLMWPAFERVAHTLVYDSVIMGDYSVPAQRMALVKVPTLVIDGGTATWPWLRTGLAALTASLPQAERRSVEGQSHDVDSAALAPVLMEFFQ